MYTPVRGDTCTQPLHRHIYGVHGKSTRQLHVRVDGRCAAAYGPCTRPCNVSCTRPYNVSCACYMAAVYTAVNTPSPAKTARTRPCNGRAVYTARTRPCMGRAHVYTTRLHDCVRAVCTDVFGRVHGAYTAPYTGCVHGPVLVVHTAVYTTRIRPRTRVYVYAYGPSTWPKTAVYTTIQQV